MLRFAADGVLSFSFAPLRLAVWTGFAAIAVAFGGIVYALLLRFLFDPSHWVRGWTSLFVAVLFLGGVQLLSLGIIGEYVGRIYGEVRAGRSTSCASVWASRRRTAAAGLPTSRRRGNPRCGLEPAALILRTRATVRNRATPVASNLKVGCRSRVGRSSAGCCLRRAPEPRTAGDARPATGK
jgi:hypothetical protein